MRELRKINHHKFFSLILIVGWTVLIALSLIFIFNLEKKSTQRVALAIANASLMQDKMFRFWATTHGGVYVPATKRTPPNKALLHIQNRDLYVNDKNLTLMNPAYMLRQMMNEYEGLYGLKGHITSLNPLNPDNKADSWEHSILESYYKDKKNFETVSNFIGSGKTQVLRVMEPLITKKGCLKCHAHQGYKIGDLRGGVSVTLPMNKLITNRDAKLENYFFNLFLVWIVGLINIGLFYKSRLKNIKNEEELHTKLVNNEQYLTTVLNTDPNIVITSIGGHDIEMGNKSMLDFTGFNSIEEFKGKYDCICDLFVNRDGYLSRENYDNWVSYVSTHPSEIHKVIMKKDGVEYVFIVSANKLDFNTHDRYVVVFNDVTELIKSQEFLQQTQYKLKEDIEKRKNAESIIKDLNKNLEKKVEDRTNELVTQKDKAEEANRAKSIFLANMSHELRTPLNAILGFSQIMLNDSKTTTTQKENLNIISKSGEHLLKLINDILNMSKIEAGRMELEISDFDLLLLLDEVSQMVKIKADEKGLIFKMDIHSDCIRFIRSDSSKIRQILINIIGNSIKYTDEGGVSLKIMSNTTDKDDFFKMTFEIEDSGRGISKEELKTIFEPFTQVKSSKGVTEGTGLGLSITHKFLKLMNAEIDVSSKVGVGTTFTFSFEVKKVSSNDIKAHINHSNITGILKSKKEYKILIAEDQKDNLVLLRNLLQGVGFDVYEAHNGKEAVEMFKEIEPDFIWMDMRMPIMDGYEASKAIRFLKNSDKATIVALTASAFREQHKNILDAGCNDIVHKPYRQEKIFETMEKYLDIEYIYQETDTSQKDIKKSEINLDELNKLPQSLKDELRDVLIELEGDKIISTIEKVKEFSVEAYDLMMFFAENFEYDKVLKALESTKK